MAALSDNWFIEPVFDFEYKSYQVLGYAKSVNEQFSNWKFFPYMDDLQKHIDLISSFAEAKKKFHESLPKTIEDIDIANQKIISGLLSISDGVMSEIEDITKFANQHFGSSKSEAEGELKRAESNVQIRPVGILDNAKNSGLLLIRKPAKTRVYKYDLRLVRRFDNIHAYKDIRTIYMDELSTGMFTNFNDIKWNMIKAGGALTGTNAYLVETSVDVPLFESLMPIVKNYLIRQAG